jgi:uncharacterized protein
MNFSQLKRVLKIMVITTLTLGIIGIVAFEELAMPYMPISPWKRTSTLTPAEYGLRADSLNVAVEKDIILRGYFLYANTPKPKGTIIMVHGIGGFKEGFLGFAKILSDNGYNTIIYDQRAHGKSDGKYCTFGFYEKYDVSKFVDIAEAKFPNLPVGIQGSSMGGAVALQALAVEKRLKFGIVESTFNRLEDIVMEYGEDYFKFKSRWLAQRVLSKSAEIAHYKPFDIKPVEAAAQIEQPMLLVHGDKDTKVPIAFNQENFAALKSREKEFYTVHGAGHLDVGAVGGTAYLSKIMTFVNKQCIGVEPIRSF